MNVNQQIKDVSKIHSSDNYIALMDEQQNVYMFQADQTMQNYTQVVRFANKKEQVITLKILKAVDNLRHLLMIGSITGSIRICEAEYPAVQGAVIEKDPMHQNPICEFLSFEGVAPPKEPLIGEICENGDVKFLILHI